MRRVTFALPHEQYDKLDAQAAAKGISIGEYLRHVLMAVSDRMYSEY
jgi:hypothetical protein